MIELYRFDVDYLDEERGIKHTPCDDGDYVLAEDALALQAKVEELESALGALVALKTHKDIRGKDEHYLRNQPAAWEQAKVALKQEQGDSINGSTYRTEMPR